MTPSKNERDDEATAQQLLKKAYVLMNFGFFEKAINYCEKAAHESQQSDQALVAESLHGAILTASGRPVEAMRKLMPLRRRHGDAILVALYLAEACFLAGRHRRAWKTLDEIDEQELSASPWADFGEQLRTTWEQLSDLDDLSTPLTVPLGEEPVVTEM